MAPCTEDMRPVELAIATSTVVMPSYVRQNSFKRRNSDNDEKVREHILLF
jgi:hypothetical protein